MSPKDLYVEDWLSQSTVLWEGHDLGDEAY